jgi:hypothetical protein
VLELMIGSRNCIAGIMKSMSLSYIPPKEFKDDPPITLALFSPTPSITLLDYNFPRLPINDIKGFEIIILLFASLFNDVIKSSQNDGGLTSSEIKKETHRLQKLEEKEEKAKKARREQIDKETERLRKMEQEELAEKKRKDAEIAKETERLRRQEGWYNDNKPPLPQRPPSVQSVKKKHWWNLSSGGENWNQRDLNGYQGNGPKYTITGGRMMGYSH